MKTRKKNKQELRSFLGLCTYYRRFVSGFAKIAVPLHKLTEDRTPFNWSQECDEAFRRLKAALCSSPILAFPRQTGKFILDTDASHNGLGAVLSQIQEGEEKVIEYYSKVLSKPERNYCVTRKELLAIVKSIDHFHKYLYGREFLVRTDHASLRWLMQLKNPEGQMARWLEKLQQYNFVIQYRVGRSHKNADALSRRPCPEDCRHCAKQEKGHLVRRTFAISEESEALLRRPYSKDCQRHEKKEKEQSVGRTTVSVHDNWTTEKLREDQQNDPNLRDFLTWKESGQTRPLWKDVSDRNSVFKALWAQWDSLIVENGLLKRLWESADGKSFISQLVVPSGRVTEVLQQVHGGSSGGHFGINKTINKIRERFYWVYLREDVEHWCKTCPVCSASKGRSTRSRGEMKQYNVGVPFERIAIDVAGPFPKSDLGNKYVLVAMDYFTKWPEAYAIPNQEAATVAQVLVDNMFSRFGVPLVLHSDQGRNFESAVFKEVCALLGINKTRTTPLHPQSDGMVERFNRTMEEHLSKVVQVHQRDWDLHLPLFLMAYRASVHDSTGYTPARLVFGRELRLPCDLVFGSPNDESKELTDYADRLRKQLSDIHEVARQRLKLASDRMKARYDLKANSSGFSEGAKVWFYNPQRKKGICPKLSPSWEGPYTVIKRINDVVYRIQKSPRHKMKVVHMERLRPFYGPIDLQLDRDDQI